MYYIVSHTSVLTKGNSSHLIFEGMGRFILEERRVYSRFAGVGDGAGVQVQCYVNL